MVNGKQISFGTFALVVGLLLVALASGGLAAQSQVTMGDLVTANNNYPFNYTVNGRFQVAYSAAEINKPSGAPISHVEFHGQNIAPIPTYTNFQLRMAHSTLTPLTTTGSFDTNYTPPLVVALQGNIQATQSPGMNGLFWYKFTLSTWPAPVLCTSRYESRFLRGVLRRGMVPQR